MKSILRTLTLLVFTVAVLWVMHRYGLLDVDAVIKALTEKPEYVLLIMGTQVGLQILLLFRYRRIAETLGIRIPVRHMAAASFVSSAVGQWVPGALAVIEVIRVGLMIGADRHSGGTRGGGSDARLRARLAVASVIDRLLGFCTMMAAGAVCCAITVARIEDAKLRVMVAVLGIALLAGACTIGALPVLARIPWWQRLLERWELSLMGEGLEAPVTVVAHSKLPVPARKVLRKGVAASRLLLQTLHWDKAQARMLLRPLFLGFVTHLVACFAIYESSVALGTPISLIAILSVFPVTALSSVLPIGFGGLGGYQLVAVAIFQAFAVPPSVAASATLLQNGLMLLTNSLLGAVFAQLSAAQIRAILDSRRRVG